MLDNEFKKSAIEKLKSMDSNELKKAFKAIGSLQTNEEWLRSCNTEQLAEFLSKLPMRPCKVCPKWETYCISHSGSPCWEDGNEYDLWKAWLKQPHTP